MSAETLNSASERVATRFNRMMNASTSPYGVVADLTAVAAISAVPFILFVRQVLAGEASSPLTILFGVLTMAPVIATASVGFVLAPARARVVEWMASKPFPIDNLNALLNGLGDGFEVTFEYGVPVPEREEIQPLLDRVSEDTLYTGKSDEESRMDIRTGVIDSKRLPLRTNYLRYERFQRIVDEVLVPLHARLPIKGVRIQ